MSNKQVLKLTISQTNVVLFFLLVFLSLVACNNKQNTQFAQPEYVDIAAAKISKYRNDNNSAAGFSYIDSLKSVFFNKDEANKYFIYYLYYDSYNRIGDQDKAIAYIDSMQMVLDGIGNLDLLHKHYTSINYYKADILFKKKEFDNAYKHYYSALSISQKYNDSCNQYYYYLVLANVMYRNEQYSDALHYYKSTTAYLGDCYTYFWTYYRRQQAINNIGLCYEHLEMYDSSLVMYTNVLNYIKSSYKEFADDEIERINIARAVVQGNLGSTYMKLGDYGKAEQLFIESIDTNDKKGRDRIDAQFNRIKLATLYLKMNKAANAKTLLDKVKLISDTLKNAKVNKRWNHCMWMYWERQGEPVKAYENLSAYQKITDSLKKENDAFSVADVDARVGNIAKELQIKKLEENADTRKVYLAVAVVVTALALIIAFLVVQILRRSRRHVRMLKVMNGRIDDQRKKLKATYDELEALDSEKDRILKAVSHDMRSPINSAIALIDLLIDNSDNLNDEQKEYIQLIKSSCDSALTLTKDLLEVATLNAAQLEKELVNVNEFISESVGMIKYRAAQKSQEIILSTPGTVISAYINREKMRRVVNNLITNAIKFSPENSKINVSLLEEDGKMRIQVKDRGIGIPTDISSKIFDVFTDAKRFGTSGEQPYGLGLSISKQIVESHNGEIWFETEEGKGTSFFITVPLN